MMVNVLAEGSLDAEAARRLLIHCGLEVGTVYGRQGVEFLKAKLPRFAKAASPFHPLFVLTDFADAKSPCPAAALAAYLPHSSVRRRPGLLLRFSVQELEGWLLADRKGVSTLLGISVGVVPKEPELEPDPKRAIVNLARRSHKTKVLTAFVPSERHGGVVGPGYTAMLTEFIAERWNPDAARKAAPSLDRCLRRLEEWRDGGPSG